MPSFAYGSGSQAWSHFSRSMTGPATFLPPRLSNHGWYSPIISREPKKNSYARVEPYARSLCSSLSLDFLYAHSRFSCATLVTPTLPSYLRSTPVPHGTMIGRTYQLYDRERFFITDQELKEDTSRELYLQSALTMHLPFSANTMCFLPPIGWAGIA